MKFAGSGKVTRNGQITIPKNIRERLGLQEGDVVEIYHSGDLVVVKKKKQPKEIFEEVAKTMRQSFKQQDLTREDIREEIHAYRKEETQNSA